MRIRLLTAALAVTLGLAACTHMPAAETRHSGFLSDYSRLVDDPVWPVQLAAWSAQLPRPKAILVVSAHWEEAPVTLGATTPVPLVYDFWGFPERYYQVTYPAPGAPELAERIRQLLGPRTLVAQDPTRGLDHGAYVPLTVMYPDAEILLIGVSDPAAQIHAANESVDPEELERMSLAEALFLQGYARMRRG